MYPSPLAARSLPLAGGPQKAIMAKPLPPLPSDAPIMGWCVPVAGPLLLPIYAVMGREVGVMNLHQQLVWLDVKTVEMVGKCKVVER